MYKGRNHCFKVDGFICDAPARSFILCVKGHSGYFGCTKCIKQGEYIGRVVFLEHNAPARTDQSFRECQFEDPQLAQVLLNSFQVATGRCRSYQTFLQSEIVAW